LYTWLDSTAPCVLYTVFPSEVVLAGWEEVPEVVEVPLGSDIIQLRADARGHRLERLISADPSLYLDPRLAPGRKLSLLRGPHV
jgi:hypothetical protein